MKIKIIKLLMIMLFIILSTGHIYGAGISTSEPTTSGPGIPVITVAAKNAWSTVVIIVQILAVAAVVFAGLRYMFASADDKASIKKGMTILVVGAVLVFATTTILTLIKTATTEIL